MESALTGVVPSIKTYKYRWVILLIFCLYAAINFLQFLQYAIIANIVADYYSIDGDIVDLAGLIFMVCFILFCLPCNSLIERYNLRVIAILSSGLTAIGTLIKLGSIDPDRFYVVMIAQFFCAMGQVFILSLPSKLANTWFGSEQVSTACAIAIFGIHIGIATGCVFPASLVKSSDNIDDIGDGLFTMQIINASVTVAIFVLVLIFFRARPPLPPSQSQVNIIESHTPSMKTVVKAMAKNRDYLLLLATVGISNGLWSCFGIIINRVYLHYFSDAEAEVGVITAIAVIAGGCVGTVVFGSILDRWHKFKLTTFGIIIAAAVSYIFVVFTLEEEIQLATYFSFPIFGFFLASTLVVGFEFATEIMYPIPEAVSCSVVNAFIYIFSIIFTLITNALFDNIGYLYSHVFVLVLLLISSVFIYFISPNLHRRQANVTGTN